MSGRGSQGLSPERASPGTVAAVKPLHTGALHLTSDSRIVMGPVHQRVLEDRKLEYEQLLANRKEKLEEDFRSVLARAAGPSLGMGLGDRLTPDILQEGVPRDELAGLRRAQQEQLTNLTSSLQNQLDTLYTRMRNSWTQDPRTKPGEGSVTRLDSREQGDSVYLARELGPALRQALAELCVLQPWDPIEHLALWLRNYSRSDCQARQEAVFRLKVDLAREAEVAEQETALIRRNEAVLIQQEEHRRKEEFKQRQDIAEQQDDVFIKDPDKPTEISEDSITPSAEDTNSDEPTSDSPIPLIPVQEETGPKRGFQKKQGTPSSLDPALYTISEKDSEAAGEGEREES